MLSYAAIFALLLQLVSGGIIVTGSSSSSPNSGGTVVAGSGSGAPQPGGF